MPVSMNRRGFLALAASATLAGCGSDAAKSTPVKDPNSTNTAATEQELAHFSSMRDDDFHQFVRDSIQAQVASLIPNEDIAVEDVTTAYVSREYIEELAYNSQANVYFGKTLEELEDQFQGQRYTFYVNEFGETDIRAFEGQESNFDQITENVLIGVGVISICVTISVAAGPVATALGAASTGAKVALVFSAAAKNATIFAAGTSVISGLTAAFLEGLKTGDMQKAIEAAELAASEGFKVGAISGAISGALAQGYELANSIPTWRDSELRALKKFGGEEQVAFLDGEIVDRATEFSTRPDIIRTLKNGKLEAIEVKNYDLKNPNNYAEMVHVLKREVTDRAKNLPVDSVQRIVLDVKGRGYSKTFKKEVCEKLLGVLKEIDPSVIVEIL